MLSLVTILLVLNPALPVVDQLDHNWTPYREVAYITDLHDDEGLIEVKPPASPSLVWDRLARCESGGDWSINTGNGYYGGLQFSLESWRWVGGSEYPHEHLREVQIELAERLLEEQGWEAWPACSRKLGLR